MLWPIGAYNRYTKQDNVTKSVAQVIDGLRSRAKVSLGKTLECQPACYGGRTACMAALPHTRLFNKQVVSWQEHHFNILDLYLFACLLALFEHAGTRMYLTNV